MLEMRRASELDWPCFSSSLPPRGRARYGQSHRGRSLRGRKGVGVPGAEVCGEEAPRRVVRERLTRVESRHAAEVRYSDPCLC